MATKRQLLDDPRSVFNKAGMDEPLFVLTASDQSSPEAILAWVAKGAQLGVSPEKLQGALAVFIETVRWQRANPMRVKLPD